MIYVYVYMHVCKCVFMHVYTKTLMYNIRARAHTHTCTCTCTYIIYANEHTRTQTHTRMHIYAYTYTCVHVYMHMCACVRVYIYTGGRERWGRRGVGGAERRQKGMERERARKSERVRIIPNQGSETLALTAFSSALAWASASFNSFSSCFLATLARSDANLAFLPALSAAEALSSTAVASALAA
jgi:hypothetical protein